MTKKIICLVLALLMVVPVLASCSNDTDAVDDLNEDASRFTTTLNMWIITESATVARVGELICSGLNPALSEKKMTEEQKATVAALTEVEKDAWEQVWAISEAVNRLTKAKFKTKINLRYVLEEEYYTKVEASFKAHAAAIEAEKEAARAEREAIKNGLIPAPSTKEEEEKQTDETVYNQYGVPELKYPVAKDYQVDILFIGDYEKYRTYAEEEWLFGLDAQLADSALKLSYYLSSMLMEAARYEGVIYGVPNNGPIGEYTYLLVNNELMNRLGYTEGDFSSIYDAACEDFLDLVFSMDEDVYPIYSENGKVDLSFVHYWNYDLSTPGSYILKPDEFSLFGGVYSDESVRGTTISYNNLLSSTIYKNLLLLQAKYEGTEGYITQDPEAKSKAAVRIENGGWELKEQYEAQGYTVLTMEAPRATDETVYSSMFAVGGFTEDEERAMEIITYLNTNTEFRNLLQYGIEGVNYELKYKVDEKTKKEYPYVEYTKENTYWMDVTKTGNMFMAYPEGEKNILMWENAKAQNLEALAYPTLGMYFDLGEAAKEYKIDVKSMLIIDAVSEKIAAYLENVRNGANAVAAIEELYGKTSSYYNDNNGMAKLLLELIGTEVTYVMNGKTEVVTQADLAAAITCMRETELSEPDKGLQSPNALYLYWREMAGLS